MPWTESGKLTGVIDSPAAQPASTKAPSAYTAPLTIEAAATANGWPSAGILETARQAGGTTVQRLTVQGATDVGGAVLVRSASSAASSWGPWLNQAVALTYANGWANFGSGFRSGNAVLTEADMVVLGGVLAPGTVTSGTTITTLPAQMKPNNQHSLFVHGASGTTCELNLLTSGELKIISGTPGSYLTLTGLAFRR